MNFYSFPTERNLFGCLRNHFSIEENSSVNKDTIRFAAFLFANKQNVEPKRISAGVRSVLIKSGLGAAQKKRLENIQIILVEAIKDCAKQQKK